MKTKKELIQTAHWIQAVVLGLNLCPFAHSVFKNDTIRYTLCETDNEAEIEKIFKEELQWLIDHPLTSTSFIILAQQNDFLIYLDLIENLNHYLQEHEMDEHFQIASFHPKYIFAGSTESDPANYTNRSPYPMIHILRESELSKGIDRYPNTDDIPKNNIRLLRKMGLEEIQKILNESNNQ